MTGTTILAFNLGKYKSWRLPARVTSSHSPISAVAVAAGP